MASVTCVECGRLDAMDEHASMRCHHDQEQIRPDPSSRH